MGLTYNVYLSSAHRVYGCRECKTHLATHEDILSRVEWLPPDGLQLPTDFALTQNFRGQHGKAFLFDNVVNIASSEASERSMTTGRHIVRDIMCKQCKATVGWKYDKAFETSEKYKEGKYILEAELLVQVT